MARSSKQYAAGEIETKLFDFYGNSTRNTIALTRAQVGALIAGNPSLRTESQKFANMPVTSIVTPEETNGNSSE